jgi:hypothetical protein
MSHEFHPGDRVRSPGGGCVRVIDHLGPNLLDVYVPFAFFVGGGFWPVTDLEPAEDPEQTPMPAHLPGERASVISPKWLLSKPILARFFGLTPAE